MLTVHTLVLNEENFLWYSLASVISYVDKFFLWDTGSTDSTPQIIKELIKRWPEKIEFREIGKVDERGLVEARQKMLDETKSDWIMLLDGDEVWWEGSIKKVISEIASLANDVLGVATPFYNCVGDIFHYQEEAAGRYRIAGKSGHLTLRFMRTNGLKVLGTYPYEFYTLDGTNPLQESSKIQFIDTPYLHLTHLPRSGKGGKRKEKAELGIPFPLDFYYPEVFFRERPTFVPSPWKTLKGMEFVKALVATPMRHVKRNIF